MGQITAYKCDVCGSVSESDSPFSYRSHYGHDDSPMNEFSFYCRPAYAERKSACSDACLNRAMVKWMNDRIEEDRIEKEASARPADDLAKKLLQAHTVAIEAELASGELKIERVS